MAQDRTYKELIDQQVKMGEMTAGEFAMFNRVNDSLKPAKERGAWGTFTKGIRGSLRSIGDNFVEKAEVTELYDRKARKGEIQEELGDLQQALDAGKIGQKKYNLVKAQLEVELEDL